MRPLGSAGTLLGAGAVFAYGSYNTISACSGTSDSCGNTNVTPLVILAAGSLIVGATLAVVSVALDR